MRVEEVEEKEEQTKELNGLEKMADGQYSPMVDTAFSAVKDFLRDSRNHRRNDNNNNNKDGKNGSDEKTR